MPPGSVVLQEGGYQGASVLPSPSTEGARIFPGYVISPPCLVGSSQGSCRGMKHGLPERISRTIFLKLACKVGCVAGLSCLRAHGTYLFPGKLRASLDEVKTDFLSFLG